MYAATGKTLGKERILEIERGNTGLHWVQNSLWER
jgi:hypothetical protein